MSYAPPSQPRNVLSLVHRVFHDGGRITTYLIGFSYPDKGLYTALLGADFCRLGFRGLELTECTTNGGVPDHARNGAPSEKMKPTDDNDDTDDVDAPTDEEHERQMLGIFWRASKSGHLSRGGR